MKFDFCFAAFNSEKHLDKCVQAILKLNYDKKQISLYFADNASQDNTVKTLNMLKSQYESVFAKFEIITMPSNKGFGTASNAAARAGNGEYVFFFNLDTEICENALLELQKEIECATPECVAFELRQFPYEHPKYYDPITMEVSWASGAAFVLRRDVFSKTGGFDPSIFMYAEDVELSWRLRLFGYKIKYVPKAVTYHYTYEQVNEIKPSLLAGCVAGNLMLRYKYGQQKDIERWRVLYESSIDTFNNMPLAKEMFQKQYDNIKEHKKEYRSFYKKFVKGSDFEPQFLDFDYEFARDGTFFVNEFPDKTPKFSVLVRTYKRPEVLRLTLKSLKNQTYNNFEVVVVEDGENPISEQVVTQESDGLDIKYYPLKKQAGRCKAGNVAIEKASGEFLVFLDDDDYFFADALEVFAQIYDKNPDCSVLVAGAIEAQCTPLNEDGSSFEYVKKILMSKTKLEMVDLSYENPLPIQAIAFKKELAVKYGGFDETLDALEDWDLWQRYIAKEKAACTPKSTSIYKVPSEEKKYDDRNLFMAQYRKIILERMKEYNVNISAQDIYALVWNKKEKDESFYETIEEHNENYKKELRVTINKIKESKTWRASAIIRWPIFAIGYPILWILQGIGFAFGQVAKLFNKIKNILQSGLDKVAPVINNVENKDEKEMHKFVMSANRSFCMNLFKKH